MESQYAQTAAPINASNELMQQVYNQQLASGSSSQPDVGTALLRALQGQPAPRSQRKPRSTNNNNRRNDAPPGVRKVKGPLVPSQLDPQPSKLETIDELDNGKSRAPPSSRSGSPVSVSSTTKAYLATDPELDGEPLSERLAALLKITNDDHDELQITKVEEETGRGSALKPALQPDAGHLHRRQRSASFHFEPKTKAESELFTPRKASLASSMIQTSLGMPSLYASTAPTPNVTPVKDAVVTSRPTVVKTDGVDENTPVKSKAQTSNALDHLIAKLEASSSKLKLEGPPSPENKLYQPSRAMIEKAPVLGSTQHGSLSDRRRNEGLLGLSVNGGGYAGSEKRTEDWKTFLGSSTMRKSKR